MGSIVTEDQLREVTLHVTQALGYIDKIVDTNTTEVTYETMQKAGFNRKENWRRKYSLKDARDDARTAAVQIRAAWDLLDPM